MVAGCGGAFSVALFLGKDEFVCWAFTLAMGRKERQDIWSSVWTTDRSLRRKGIGSFFGGV